MNSIERLTTGELAKRSAVNVETIRYYERQRLLPRPPRSSSGYRLFPSESIDRIRFIKQAQELGFSLKEIKDLLALRIDPHSTSAEVRNRAEAKIIDIDEKIETLRSMRRALERLTAACKGRGSAAECPILGNLSSERK
ncbi:MAG: heavy metal-responsive transcriptional regulator [Pyrinomonadaceae bacterium]